MNGTQQQEAVAQAELAHFQRDVDYYNAHYRELLATHPDEYVAIFNQEVVGAGPQLDELLDHLRRGGVPPELTVIKHPSSEQETWIFHL